MAETTSREMALPGAALSSLHRTLRSEVGTLSAIHALQTAGYEAGGEMLPGLLRSARGRALGDLPRDEFWELLQSFFLRKGWGRLVHHSPHPAVGMLVASGWAEADEEGRESQPACAFTSGMLSNILTRVAGASVAVLELRCRSRGDDECHFAFGSEDMIHRLYGELLDGAGFDDALTRIGRTDR